MLGQHLRRTRLTGRAWLSPLARAAGAREILDGPVPPDVLRASLADIERLNRRFGGCSLTLSHVRALLSAAPADRAVTIVDVGTGGGDIPRALVRWARGARRAMRVLAIDRDPAVLDVARSAAREYPEISFIAADAAALPFDGHRVDVAISALMLHHLEPASAVRSLGEMNRVARRGVVVNDLERSRLGWALVWISTRLLAREPASRHDGPLSVRRAYTAEELSGLCAEAGLAGARILRYPALVRQCAVHVKP